MAKRKRQYNTIRTDTLEDFIAFYEATGRDWEAQVIRRLAKKISAPIEESEIERLKEERYKGINGS